jgi:hypothetical protein
MGAAVGCNVGPAVGISAHPPLHIRTESPGKRLSLWRHVNFVLVLKSSSLRTLKKIDRVPHVSPSLMMTREGSGRWVGVAEGVAVGLGVGVNEGAPVGAMVGGVGVLVGTGVGDSEGAPVGTAVVGVAVGLFVGARVQPKRHSFKSSPT